MAVYHQDRQAPVRRLLVLIIIVSLNLATQSPYQSLVESKRLWDPRNSILESENWSSQRRTPFRSRQQVERLPLERRLVDGLPVGLRNVLLDADSFDEDNSGDTKDKREELPAVNLRQLSYIVSPLTNRVVALNEAIGNDDNRNPFADSFAENGARKQTKLVYPTMRPGKLLLPADECATTLSSVQLNRDDEDHASGQVLRTCKGVVQINRCDGSCSSSVQPSVKSSTGFIKRCSCCKEASFRKVQVRLNECYSPNNNKRILANPDDPSGFMDIEIDEPIDCKCRRCQGQV